MAVLRISSAGNPLLKEYRRLLNGPRYRRAAGKMALEGPLLTREALRAGLMPETVFFSAAFARGKNGALLAEMGSRVRRVELPENLFHRLVETDSPQGVAAVLPLPEVKAPSFSNYGAMILLERLQDPGNMGTVLRTGAAAGIDAVYFTPDCADPYAPKVLRAAAGALFHLNLLPAQNPLALIRDLKARDYRVLAAMPGGGQPHWEVDFRQAFLLIIGNEGAGISQDLSAAADTWVTIPQAGQVQSLNAAVAAAVILYEALRQRKGGPPQDR